MDCTDKSCIWICISSIHVIPSGRFTTMFVLNFCKKNHSRLSVILDAIKTKIHENNLRIVFLNRVNLCRERIHTWSLIFEYLFVLFFLISSERWKFHRIEITKNSTSELSCTPVDGSLNCHRITKSSCFYYLSITLKPSFSIR